MLVLDDLHAADAPSILLLRFVARELGDARVLVLGAYRDMELDRGHPLAVALGELSREPAARHVPLSGLAEAASMRRRGRAMRQPRRTGTRRRSPRCGRGRDLMADGFGARIVHGEGDHLVDEVATLAPGQAVAVGDQLELPGPGRGVRQPAPLTGGAQQVRRLAARRTDPILLARRLRRVMWVELRLGEARDQQCASP